MYGGSSAPLIPLGLYKDSAWKPVMADGRLEHGGTCCGPRSTTANRNCNFNWLTCSCKCQMTHSKNFCGQRRCGYRNDEKFCQQPTAPTVRAFLRFRNDSPSSPIANKSRKLLTRSAMTLWSNYLTVPAVFWHGQLLTPSLRPSLHLPSAWGQNSNEDSVRLWLRAGAPVFTGACI